MIADRKSDIGRTNEYEVALQKALQDLSAARQEEARAKDRLAETRATSRELADLVRSLVAILPPDQRKVYEAAAKELGAGDHAPSRGSHVYDNVIGLFSRTDKQEWTATQVQSALAVAGSQASAKSVYNVLNYMERKGRLRRISRGRYLIADLGVGIDLGHDLPGVDAIGGHAMDE